MLTQLQTRYGFSLTAHENSFFAKEIQRSEGNPFYRDGVGTYEHFESEKVLSLVRPNDFCIDGGAHIGYFACLMAFAGANVLASEPNPMHAEALRKNANRFPGHITITTAALTDQDGEANFNSPSEFDDGLGSLCWDQAGQKISVQTVRLDTVIEPNVGIRLLKLDVEGSELAALRGLGERLSNVEFILLECASSNSEVPGINDLLAGWKVERCGLGEWRQMPRALPDGNYLFTNPN